MESALADYFAAIANCFTSKDTPAGCFMINNCTTLSPDSGDIGNTLKSRHAMQERTLQQFYVNDKRAVKSRPTVT